MAKESDGRSITCLNRSVWRGLTPSCSEGVTKLRQQVIGVVIGALQVVVTCAEGKAAQVVAHAQSGLITVSARLRRMGQQRLVAQDQQGGGALLIGDVVAQG